MAKTCLPPGFRFHPSDVELILYYLKRKILGKKIHYEAIAEIDIYQFTPWDLPDKSCLKSRDQEWYFLCPRNRRYTTGSRTNRATADGFWKTTGEDRSINHNSQTVGMKKTLIFYIGRAPRGVRTDWVMHEYRLEEGHLAGGFLQNNYVLCKLFRKSGRGPRNGEQHGAPFIEEDWDNEMNDQSLVVIPTIAFSSHSLNDQLSLLNPVLQTEISKTVVNRTSLLNYIQPDTSEPHDVPQNIPNSVDCLYGLLNGYGDCLLENCRESKDIELSGTSGEFTMEECWNNGINNHSVALIPTFSSSSGSLSDQSFLNPILQPQISGTLGQQTSHLNLAQLETFGSDDVPRNFPSGDDDSLWENIGYEVPSQMLCVSILDKDTEITSQLFNVSWDLENELAFSGNLDSEYELQRALLEFNPVMSMPMDEQFIEIKDLELPICDFEQANSYYQNTNWDQQTGFSSEISAKAVHALLPLKTHHT